MSITIKDLARMLNISHTTVSRSLNNSPLISAETREKVKAMARKHGYVPNFSARGLVLARSYNIGLFFSTLKSGTTPSFLLEAIRGVNSVIKGKYRLALEAIDDFETYEEVNRRGFDGIVLMSQDPRDDVFIAHVLHIGLPLVVLNREVPGQNVTCILSDDLMGAYKATQHLIEYGHRHIAHIEGKPEFKTSLKRKEGYLRALDEAGIHRRRDYCVPGDFGLESGYHAMTRILALPDCPTAVFCANDDMAIGAMKAIYEAGLKIPEEISLMGYDDNGVSAYQWPPLTTVKRPIEEIAIEGADRLVAMLEESRWHKADPDNDGKAELIHLPTEMRIRSSVRRIPPISTQTPIH